MNTLLIYMAKAAFYMAAFYFVYFAMLSSDTQYSRNRAYIIFSLILSLILPLITLQTSKPVNIPVFGKTLSEIFVYGTNTGQINTNSSTAGTQSLNIILIVYLAGVSLFGLKLLKDLIELVVLIVKRKTGKNLIISFHGFNTSGFSGLGYIFINAGLNPEESAEIIKHEQNHIDRHHFIDIILIEIISMLQWFNPFVHMFNRSLRAIHEYQADEGCLKKGIPVNSYQKLLLNQIFRSNIFGLTNCFSNPTLIKKRMIMMTKKRSTEMANLKILFVLPAVAAVMVAFSSCAEKSIKEAAGPDSPALSPTTEVIQSPPALAVTTPPVSEIAPPPPPPPPKSAIAGAPSDEVAVQVVTADQIPPTEVFIIVEEMPSFPGGDEAMMKFINENIKYPDIAKENNIQGRVILRFCVTYQGAVDQVTVLKGVDPDLDAEAVRVIKTLPGWKPGRQDGKPVNVWYALPINFALK